MWMGESGQSKNLSQPNPKHFETKYAMSDAFICPPILTQNTNAGFDNKNVLSSDLGGFDKCSCQSKGLGNWQN